MIAMGIQEFHKIIPTHVLLKRSFIFFSSRMAGESSRAVQQERLVSHYDMGNHI